MTVLLFFFVSVLLTAPSNNVDPLSPLIKSFLDQVARALPVRESRPTLILETFSNLTNLGPELVNEIYQRTKSGLQERGFALTEILEEESKLLDQKPKGEEVKGFLIKGVISETMRNVAVSAKIISLPENKPLGMALSTVKKNDLTPVSATVHGGGSSMLFQEIFRSESFPFKILDIAPSQGSSDQHSLLVLSVSDLLLFDVQNNKLIQRLKIPVPIDENAIPSRDPRGVISLYRYKDKDLVMVATDRSNGTYLLRDEDGKLYFEKLAMKWILNPGQLENPAFRIFAKLVAGRNYFQSDIGLIPEGVFSRALTNHLEQPIREEDLATLRVQEGKIKPFYELAVLNQSQPFDPILVFADIDGGITLYSAGLKEITSHKGPAFGPALGAYFDRKTEQSFLFVSSNIQVESNDFVSVFSLKDQKLRYRTSSLTYRGLITGVKAGTLISKDEVNVVAISENGTGPAIESVILVFSLLARTE